MTGDQRVSSCLRQPAATTALISRLFAGKANPGAAAKPQLVPLNRSNNVAIMLTQFGDLKDPAMDVRACVLSGKGLSVDRLSLLLQVHALSNSTPVQS